MGGKKKGFFFKGGGEGVGVLLIVRIWVAEMTGFGGYWPSEAHKALFFFKKIFLCNSLFLWLEEEEKKIIWNWLREWYGPDPTDRENLITKIDNQPGRKDGGKGRPTHTNTHTHTHT